MASGENLLFTLRPNPYTPAQIQAGVRLAYSHLYRNETSPLVRHKPLNYGDCILEKRRAKFLIGIMPVTALEQKEYSRGPVTQSCMEAYRSSCSVL